jgi:hypothetical protein
MKPFYTPLLLLVLLVSGCESVVYQPNTPNASNMSFREAQTNLMGSLVRETWRPGMIKRAVVTPESLTIVRDAGNIIFGPSIETLSFKFQEMDYCSVLYHGGEILAENDFFYVANNRFKKVYFSWNKIDDAKIFADALNALIFRSQTSTPAALSTEGGTYVWPPPAEIRPNPIARNSSNPHNAHGSPDFYGLAGRYMADGIALMVTIFTDGSFIMEGDLEGGKISGTIKNVTMQGFQVIDGNGRVIEHFEFTQGDHHSIFDKDSEGNAREFKKF